MIDMQAFECSLFCKENKVTRHHSCVPSAAELRATNICHCSWNLFRLFSYKQVIDELFR